MTKGTVTFEKVEAIKETDLALLVDLGHEEHWFPKSVIDDGSEVYQEGDIGDLVVQEWFVIKEGLV